MIPNVTSKILVKSGPKPGPTVAVFAGVHGNEPVGVLAMSQLWPTLSPSSGTLYLAYANPPAIRENRRSVGGNLNRCFVSGNEGVGYEDRRARELMSLLDKCDALLDLHAFNEPTGQPFIICEDNALPVATKMEPVIISTNWAMSEPGAADGYMYQQGKIGLCLECGPLGRPDQYLDVAKKSVMQFLQHFEIVDRQVPDSGTSKTVVRSTHSLIRTSPDFYLDPSLRSFDELRPGKLIGRHAGQQIVARAGDIIMFPRPRASIGTEAYILGRKQPV